MDLPRVFVVTGSNKGIGKSIVKLLLQDKEEKIVYLTSRNNELGEKAVKDLEATGLCPLYHQLDITDQKSIECLHDHLAEKYGGLDVLVNNAGVAFMGSNVPFPEQVEKTISCNFVGTLTVCETLFPILKTNGRVCHLSSTLGERAYLKLSESLQKMFSDPNLSIDGLKKLLSNFVTAAKEDKVTENGWAQSAYGMSKLAMSMMTILQQKAFDKDQPEKNILVNSCCPGMVNTDLAGGKHHGGLTPEEGADTPAYLALLPANVHEPKGEFVKLRKVVPFPPVS